MGEHMYANCRVCGFPAGEHSSDCTLRTPDSDRLAESNRAKVIKEGIGERAEDRSGRLFEYELLGEIDVNAPDYKEELKRLGGDARGFLPYEAAIKLAKLNQPSDPTNPKKDFMRELRLAIVEKLGLAEDQSDAVRVYTAVGSPLDKFHGIDAFVTSEEEDFENMVTIDTALRKEKQESAGKADILVTEIKPPEEDEEAYLEAIDKYAERIAEKLTGMQSSKRKAA